MTEGRPALTSPPGEEAHLRHLPGVRTRRHPLLEVPDTMSPLSRAIDPGGEVSTRPTRRQDLVTSPCVSWVSSASGGRSQLLVPSRPPLSQALPLRNKVL